MKAMQCLLGLSATLMFSSCVTLDDDDNPTHRTTTVTEETTYRLPQSSSIQTETIRTN